MRIVKTEQDGLCFCMEEGSCLRQLDASSLGTHQPLAQGLFKQPNLLRQGGLGHLQPLSSVRYLHLLRDYTEHS